MNTTPRTGQPGTAAAARDLAFPGGRAGPQGRYRASPTSRHINGTRKSEVLRVSWTPAAESDLQLVVDDPAVRDQLRRNAEVTLHEIEASAGGDRRSEGFEGEVMWHRGWDHEQERRESWHPELADDGPWNYVLFYQSAVVPAKFVVLAVRSRIQIADRIWGQLQAGSVEIPRFLSPPPGDIGNTADVQDLEVPVGVRFFRAWAPWPVEQKVVPRAVVFLRQELLGRRPAINPAMPHDLACKAFVMRRAGRRHVMQDFACLAGELVSHDRIDDLQLGFSPTRPVNLRHQIPSSQPSPGAY